MPTAAVVIIGDEILSGKFADENGPYFIERLRALGVELVRLHTIPDELDVIADTVARASEVADHVFTTGGVGPTHDDRTFEGVARAFGVPLVLEDELVALVDRFKMPRTEAVLRMARIPEGAELISGEMVTYPIVKVRNVYVFPGVPRLVKQKFEVIGPRLAGRRVACARIYALDLETDVAQALGEIQDRHPEVAIGSYPRFGESNHKLIVTFEGPDADAVAAAREEAEGVLRVVRTEGP